MWTLCSPDRKHRNRIRLELEPPPLNLGVLPLYGHVFSLDPTGTHTQQLKTHTPPS